jgi:hypothetical protein
MDLSSFLADTGTSSRCFASSLDGNHSRESLVEDDEHDDVARAGSTRIV